MLIHCHTAKSGTGNDVVADIVTAAVGEGTSFDANVVMPSTTDDRVAVCVCGECNQLKW